MKILQRIVSSVVLLSFVCTQAGAVTLQRLPTFYASTDALGSTTLVTQDDGAVVEKRSYDAFGKRRNPNWSAVDVYGQIAGAQLDQGYTSHVEDFESDTVHMRGRTYDPKLARFTSADPVIDGVNATQRWNRYAYVSNNPLKYTDPSGFTYIADPPQAPQQNETTGTPQQVVTVYQAPGEDDDNEDEDGDAEVSDEDPDPNMPPSNEAHGGGPSNGTSNGDRDGGNYNGNGESSRAGRERNAREVAQLQKNMKSDAARQRHAKEQLDGRGGSSANGNSFGMAAAPPLEGALAGGGTTGVTVGTNLVLMAGGLAVAVTAVAGIAAAGLIYMVGDEEEERLADEIVDAYEGHRKRYGDYPTGKRKEAWQKISKWFEDALDRLRERGRATPDAGKGEGDVAPPSNGPANDNARP